MGEGSEAWRGGSGTKQTRLTVFAEGTKENRKVDRNK